MIYDGFLFFNELELLELRLNELSDVVDRFILVESSVTHSGRPKPMFFRENIKLFEKWLPRIIHVEIYDTPDDPAPFAREIFQRNQILRGIPADASWGDILIVSDLDEIPRAATLKKVLPAIHSPHTLSMKSYGGYMNARSGDWAYAKVTPLSIFMGTTPEKLRHAQHPLIENGGWHFSYVGGGLRVHEKMKAFSHQEPAVQKWNDLGLLEENLKRGIGVFGGAMVFEALDDSFPRYLLENRERFKGMVWE
jgi:beta-1,4-mannosyl-glycoprotein beta-1,4-N-acetylglucosaminyltransferase